MADFYLPWLAYVVGVLGVAVEWRAYWLRCDQGFRRWSAAAALLWAAQYVLLGAWTAALTMASTALRSLLSQRLAANHAAVVGFVLLFIGLTAVSWQGVISLLPAFAVINTTLVLFYLAQRAMRWGLLLSSLAWIASDWYWQVWPALLAETVAMLINLWAIKQMAKRGNDAV